MAQPKEDIYECEAVICWCVTLTLLRTTALAFVAVNQLANAATEVAPKDVQITLLKDWALSRCLAKVYVEAAAKSDANASASAYLEKGDLPMEAYDAADRLASDYANRKYTGSIESEFGTKKCIDLFESEALSELATRQVGAQRKAR
ncbi:T6SS amidase immunity protein Tai4 family protein [Caballeronia pedi]|uniref:T6SS amidase immunity protein Tai4 family protein n=1 Tax=Caballeronia pedi TaxID=1777141 RepID=UPI0013568002|nr:T6SS amidase immunity protein Tai4 family protein [Caballeronia pedi]